MRAADTPVDFDAAPSDDARRPSMAAMTAADADVVALERKLQRVARELRALHAQESARRVALRDMAEAFRRMSPEAMQPVGAGEPTAVAGPSREPEAPLAASVLQAELRGMAFRLADREAAVALLHARARDLDAVSAERAALRGTVADLRRRVSELQVRAVESEERATRERDQAATLSVRATAHDAVLARLKRQLEEEDQRLRQHSQELARLRDDRERFRQALAAQSDALAELETLRERVRSLEARAQRALHDAEVARASDARSRAALLGARAELGAALPAFEAEPADARMQTLPGLPVEE